MSLQALPLELLTETIRYLGGPEPLLALRATCKEFRELLDAADNGSYLVLAAMQGTRFGTHFLRGSKPTTGLEYLRFALTYEKLQRRLAHGSSVTGPAISKAREPIYNQIPETFGKIALWGDGLYTSRAHLLPVGASGDGEKLVGLTSKGDFYQIDFENRTFELLDTDILSDSVSGLLGKTSPIKHDPGMHVPSNLEYVAQEKIDGLHRVVCVYTLPTTVVESDGFEWLLCPRKVYVVDNGKITASWKLQLGKRLEEVNLVAYSSGILVLLIGCASHEVRAFDVYTGNVLTSIPVPVGYDSHDLAMSYDHLWYVDGKNNFFCMHLDELLKGNYDAWHKVVKARITRLDFTISQTALHSRYITMNYHDRWVVYDMMDNTCTVYGRRRLYTDFQSMYWVISDNDPRPVCFTDEVTTTWAQLYRQRHWKGPQPLSLFDTSSSPPLFEDKRFNSLYDDISALLSNDMYFTRFDLQFYVNMVRGTLEITPQEAEEALQRILKAVIGQNQVLQWHARVDESGLVSGLYYQDVSPNTAARRLMAAWN